MTKSGQNRASHLEGKKVRLVILGGPGAGKGTQTRKLSAALQIPAISAGDFLLREVKQQTKLGQEVQPYVQAGEFVPDSLMIQLMRQWLQENDTEAGWILDGYPRTAFQAEELDFLADELQQKLDWAIWLEVSKSVLMERSLSRSRVDDEQAVIQRRIELAYSLTEPLLDYYDYRNRLLRVQADRSIDEVYAAICAALKI